MSTVCCKDCREGSLCLQIIAHNKHEIMFMMILLSFCDTNKVAFFKSESISFNEALQLKRLWCNYSNKTSTPTSIILS